MTQQDFQEDYQRWKEKLRVIENVWDLKVFEQRAQVDIDSMKQRIKRHKDWLLEDMKFYQVFLDKNRVNLKEIEKVKWELIEILRNCSEEFRDDVKTRIEATQKEIEKHRKLVNTNEQQVEKCSKELEQVGRLERKHLERIQKIRNRCAVLRKRFQTAK